MGKTVKGQRRELFYSYPNKTGRWVWLAPSERPCHVECLCDCGVKKDVALSDLEKRKSLTCVKCRVRKTSAIIRTHGETDSKLHYVWRGMKARCSNPRNKDFKHYGGRGVRVCDEWLNSFTVFRDWAMNSGYAEGLEIDRVDNDGPYTPNNCQWATRSENMRHCRHNSHLTAFGETKIKTEWLEDSRCKVTRSGLDTRLKRGWDAEKAIATVSLQWRRLAA